MKRFVLCFTVVSGSVLACGGAIETDPTQRTGTAPTATSTSSPPKRPAPPASSSGDPDPGTECPQDISLTAAELDQEIGWKNGVVSAGACTDADFARLEQNFKDTSIRTYFDLGKGLSTTCRACVVSKDTDPSWGPIVATAESNGETGFVNFGACFGVLESAACGKAVQYERFCDDAACADCATTSIERQKCVSAATSGTCSELHSETIKSCPNLASIAGTCGDLLKAAKTLCGAP